MTPIRVLGTFTPSEWEVNVIEREFRALPFLAPCCRRERVSVRYPPQPAPPAANLEWHQDGGGPEGTTHHMVIWASDNPTHLKDDAGALFVVPQQAVVWFDNTICWHKQPADTDEATRWFVAIRCSGALA